MTEPQKPRLDIDPSKDAFVTFTSGFSSTYLILALLAGAGIVILAVLIASRIPAPETESGEDAG